MGCSQAKLPSPGRWGVLIPIWNSIGTPALKSLATHMQAARCVPNLIALCSMTCDAGGGRDGVGLRSQFTDVLKQL